MLGLGIFDCLSRDMVDPETGEFYPALSCCNDKVMAERCTVPGAPKVIWSIKASAQFNSDCAFLLREGFRSGRIRLLLNDFDAEDILKSVKGYKNLTPQEQTNFMLPYIQTTLLIDELVNLQHEEVNGKLKIYEKSGMRKDRYSGISYNYYVAIQLENRSERKHNAARQQSDEFIFRAPAQYDRTVSSNGRNKPHRWG